MTLSDEIERLDGPLAHERLRTILREEWKRLNPQPPARVPRQANGEPWPGDGLGPYTEEYKAWSARKRTFDAYLECGALLDAAMTLIPKGSEQAVWKAAGDAWFSGRAATPALALAAASLRARTEEKGHG